MTLGTTPVSPAGGPAAIGERPDRYDRAVLVRSLAALTAITLIIIALSIRTLADGAIVQISGTVLYASMIYAVVVFLLPRARPRVSGAIAVGLCWAVEFSQLTGVPAALSERSALARLALGAHFDPIDVLWYPAGVVPLVLLHTLLASKRPSARGAVNDY
ncbi:MULTISPECIES: ribosomal maturation YjgA family protein [Catenuloplanes]|uniref:DUF2809 domain-containing protein n=1 Tax=Catenuloplanes niger TaxID=587534 RepID=A0AAE4CXA1_9ACTN|nr:DUF2809 domain-containing protein [Catenuloplanes niger]MDR7324599.1 hypothetical protein [Catenuloplanes niger]